MENQNQGKESFGPETGSGGGAEPREPSSLLGDVFFPKCPQKALLSPAGISSTRKGDFPKNTVSEHGPLMVIVVLFCDRISRGSGWPGLLGVAEDDHGSVSYFRGRL